ncbi:MAG: diphosphomevalonate decarboxylase [Microgenomates group bacterium]
MKKSTSRAHSNIAFIKYWGKMDDEQRLPSNGSISMNLSNLYTTTTVEFDEALVEDDITINGEKNIKKIQKVARHLDRIRKQGNILTRARVVSENNFPMGVGLSSSATGFAALTHAATHALDLSLSEREISILARLGSGSACRSIPDGFVEWKEGNTSDESYAYSLYPENHWDIIDLVALTSKKEKEVSTTEGQKAAQTSPFFLERLKNIPGKISDCKKYLLEKDFTKFGTLVEKDALEMHAIMITSQPALLYWLPETIDMMKKIVGWRKDGLEVYFTINTGQNVHLLCRGTDVGQLVKKIREVEYVKQTIINKPSKGTYALTSHLF